MNRIWLLAGIKFGYFLIAGLFLRLWMKLMFSSKLRSINSLLWRFRFLYPVLNYGLLAGYLAVMLQYPLSNALRPEMSPYAALLADDLLNLFLLLSYLVIFLYHSFLIERKTYSFHSSFGSYLKQHGYRWILVLNVVLFLRVDYFYLPLIPRNFPQYSKALLEALLVIAFLSLQLLALFVRKLNMTAADPWLKAMVQEVAGELGVKVRVVRIWRMEGVTNAFATGLLKKSIFVTERLLKIAAPEDLRMIIGHECAHFKRHHLLVRVLLISAMLCGASFLMDTYPGLNWGFYFLGGLAGLLIYKALSRYQELQADMLAANALGDGVKMAGALVRVFGLGSISRGKLGFLSRLLAGHPEPRVRNERLLGNNNR